MDLVGNFHWWEIDAATEASQPGCMGSLLALIPVQCQTDIDKQ